MLSPHLYGTFLCDGNAELPYCSQNGQNSGVLTIVNAIGLR